MGWGGPTDTVELLYSVSMITVRFSFVIAIRHSAVLEENQGTSHRFSTTCECLDEGSRRTRSVIYGDTV